MAREVEAGKAFVRAVFKDDAARKGLESFQKRFHAAGTAMMSVGTKIGASGAAMAAPLLAAAKRFASVGGQLQRVSTQVGISVEKLSALRFAASQTGVEFDDLKGSMEELNIRLGEAVLDGTGPAGEALRKLGLDAEKLSKMTPDERLRSIADALSKITNETERGFLADEIFGGDAFKILPLLRQGEAGIDSLMRKAEEMGAVLGEEDAEAASKLSRSINLVTGSIDGLAMQFGAALSPALSSLAERFAKVVSRVSGFIKENRGLVQIAGGVALAITGIGVAITALGAASIAASAAFGGLATVIGVVTSPVTLTAAAVAALTAAMGAGVFAFLKYTDAGKALTSWLKDKFGPAFEKISAIVKTAVGGIGDAISNGNWSTAATIAFEGLKAAVFTGGAALLRAFKDIMWKISVVAQSMVIGISESLASMHEMLPGGDAVARNIRAAAAAANSQLHALTKGASTGLDTAATGLDAGAAQSTARMAELAAKEAAEKKQREDAAKAEDKGEAKPGAGFGGLVDDMLSAMKDPDALLEAAKEGARKAGEGLAGAAMEATKVKDRAAEFVGGLGRRTEQGMATAGGIGSTGGTTSAVGALLLGAGFGPGSPEKETAKNTREMKEQLVKTNEKLTQAIGFQ